MGRLDGKIALITGGARGIGRGCAILFAKEGADLAIGDINISGAINVAERVRQFEKNAIAIKLDIKKSSAVNNFVNTAVKRFGRIDVLVNTIGINIESPFLEITEELWDNIIAVNLKGAFLISQTVAKEMVKNKSGKIINISSITSDLAYPNATIYTTSKAGLNSLTRCMAVDLSQYNINVNAIAPAGVVDLEEGTIMGRPLEESNLKEIKDKSLKPPLIRQVGYPKDIADVALFLASSESDLITGQVVFVDGGRTAHLMPSPYGSINPSAR